MPKVLTEALDNAGMGVEDVDWLLLHQVTVGVALALPACCGSCSWSRHQQNTPALVFGSVGPSRGGKGDLYVAVFFGGG